VLARVQSPRTDIAPKLALDALARVAERWKLKQQDLPALLGTSPRTVRAWYKRPPARLDPHVLERISHVLAIYNALNAVFGAPFADEWIHQPNHAFADRAPIELLRTGGFTELVDIRRYLDQAMAT
jgi:uncharacterized protein (DUF2384 family)